MSESEEKHLRLSKTADLWQPKRNENQTVIAAAIHTPDGAVAGGWSLGMWSNPRVRAVVDCGEMDRRDVREEIVVGNANGGKPGSHGSTAILLSHA